MPAIRSRRARRVRFPAACRRTARARSSRTSLSRRRMPIMISVGLRAAEAPAKSSCTSITAIRPRGDAYDPVRLKRQHCRMRRIAVKRGSKSGLASKTGAVALSLCFVAGSAGNAWASCAQPRDMAALRVAALRQHLMVAALACHEAAYFNRFVTSYQGEFQESDHALLKFFEHEGSGEDGYNAYKTHEANESSLLSIHDPRFCASAESAFYVALHQGLPLVQLATEEAPLLHVGYQSCSR